MKNFSRLVLILFFTSVAPFVAKAAGQVAIIDPQELTANKEPVLILDARSAASFREGRIPGSQRVDWKDWTQEQADVFGLWFGKTTQAGFSKLPDEKFQKDLRKLGLSNNKPVVVVGEPGGWGEEGRVAWNLLYWGVENVAILNGGYSAWAAISGNKPETGRIRKPSLGDFVFRLNAERRASWDEVLKAQTEKSRALIDNRSTQEFNGKSIVGQKRPGRIPGAVSVPVEKLYNADGTFVDKTQLSELFSNPVSSAPIAYCAGGVRSALFAMLWEARFGEIVPNYEGSMWEWSSRADLPLE